MKNENLTQEVSELVNTAYDTIKKDLLEGIEKENDANLLEDAKNVLTGFKISLNNYILRANDDRLSDFVALNRLLGKIGILEIVHRLFLKYQEAELIRLMFKSFCNESR